MTSRSLPLSENLPRPVPLRTLLTVLLGSFYARFGWLVLAIGLVTGWTFARHADYSAPLFAVLAKDTANGLVVEVSETHAREGCDEGESGRRIFQVRYTFVAQGSAREGVSYTSWDPPTPGQRVTIEYLRLDARLSRIRGMRRAWFELSAAVGLVFPLIGAGFLFHGLGQGIQGCQLLRKGRLSWGRLKDNRPTNVTINNRLVMALTFEFRACDGMDYQIVAKSHEPESMEDEPEELVLYDPADPAYAVVLDALPGPPVIRRDGEIAPSGWPKVVWVLAVPALSLIGAGVLLAVF